MTKRSASSDLGSRFFIVLAAALWSTGGAAIKISSLSAWQVALGRAVFAAATLYLLLPAARAKWTRETLKTALAYAGVCGLFVFANKNTTAANAIFIQNIAPVWVLLLGPWVVKEKATKQELWSVPLSLVGCALFFADDLREGRWQGNAFAAGASVCYGILIMRYRKVTVEESFSATVLGNLIIAAVCLPFSLDTAPGPKDLAAVFWLGSIQQAGGAILFLRGVKGVSALEASLLILLEPLLSPVWAYALVGEIPGPLAFPGALLILGATVWRTRSAAKLNQRHMPAGAGPDGS